VVLAVAAWMIRRQRNDAAPRLMLSYALWLLLVLVPLQFLLGDAHGLNTREYQPAKLAAIEARWDTESRAPLTLFTVPDPDAETNHASVEIPLLGSLILTHDLDTAIRGLKDFPKEDRPPVAIPFFAFRIMVGIGVLMLAIVVVGNVLRRGGRLYTNDLFLRACQWCGPLGFVAVLAGWTTTEVGRQPWTVYGLLRTADSVSPSLTAGNVALSLTGYVVAYLIIYPAGLLLIARMVTRGLETSVAEGPVQGGRPKSPINALPQSANEGFTS